VLILARGFEFAAGTPLDAVGAAIVAVRVAATFGTGGFIGFKSRPLARMPRNSMTQMPDPMNG
jgi:hypothetical protein